MHKRPNTAAIQDILYKQIRGFDISESALRLAALALYITAIELNASPRPPRALKFPRNLRGEVLHRFADQDDADKGPTVFPLGSLGPEVPREFDKTFDIVIGNPPWTRLRDRTDESEDKTKKKRHASPTAALNVRFTQIGRRVLSGARSRRSCREVRESRQESRPSLSMAAMEWCKDGGVIALAMPARLFGRTTGNGFEAWRAILRSVEVTGLINGARLPENRCLGGRQDALLHVLCTQQDAGTSEHRFHYAAPGSTNLTLNSEGRFRIDYEAAHPVSAARVEEQPWLLKTLSLGTWLDVELMEPILSSANETLDNRWAVWDARRQRTGQGFNRSPDLAPKFVDFLADLPVFEKPQDGFQIEYESLEKYGVLFGTNSEGESSAHAPRRKELYLPPLVIIPQSPGDDDESPRAYLANQAMAFSQSYYGYSCAGHPEANALAALLYLLPHSTLFAYFCLMTSRRSGFDRQTFNKEEFDALPFPDIAGLSTTTKSTIRNLAQRLQDNVRKPWRELNEFIFELYGLDADAVQVAEDTLFAAASYRRAGRVALDCTTRGTRADFITTLNDSLEPYFKVCGEHVAVREAAFQPEAWREPWFFLSVSREAEPVKVNPGLMQKAMEAANRRGCSRIIVNAPKKRGLLLGLLNQRRWWTITRARLCAQHIIRERLGACGLPEDA